MRVRIRGIIFALLTVGFSSFSYASDYVEPGRFGVEAIVTPYVYQAGFNYVNDYLDVGLDFQASHTVITNSTLNKTQLNNSAGTAFRIGKRFNIHDYNYLVLGGITNNDFGSQGNVSLAGSYAVGPYVALQRHFPNSPLMLNFFIVPYAYINIKSNDGFGGTLTISGHAYLIQGGAGLSYLF